MVIWKSKTFLFLPQASSILLQVLYQSEFKEIASFAGFIKYNNFFNNTIDVVSIQQE